MTCPRPPDRRSQSPDSSSTASQQIELLEKSGEADIGRPAIVDLDPSSWHSAKDAERHRESMVSRGLYEADRRMIASFDEERIVLRPRIVPQSVEIIGDQAQTITFLHPQLADFLESA